MYQLEHIDVDRFTDLLREAKQLEYWDDYFENLHSQMCKNEYIIQRWWAERIDLIGKRVNILNSGVGFFAVPLCFEKGATVVKTYDMCPITRQLVWRMNKGYHVKDPEYIPNYFHEVCDVTFDNDKFSYAQVYINTSVEHSYPMKDIIPDNCEVVLSGNNLTKRGHINRIESIEQLIEQSGIKSKDVKYTDEIVLEHDDELGIRNYKQFFVYGTKGEWVQ